MRITRDDVASLTFQGAGDDHVVFGVAQHLNKRESLLVRNGEAACDFWSVQYIQQLCQNLLGKQNALTKAFVSKTAIISGITKLALTSVPNRFSLLKNFSLGGFLVWHSSDRSPELFHLCLSV